MSRRDRRGGPYDAPLVSVILATRDRPRLLATTLECYRRQTYARRELIVVDDGEAYPVDPSAIQALEGRLIRVETGTTLGAKLNRGASEARGAFCQKMDDDDWYAPGFLQLMVAAVLASKAEICRPTFAMLKPFLFFDLARWELRRSNETDGCGATLFFAREDWEERPFREVRGGEDLWFFLDQLRLGTRLLPVDALESYLAVRHRGGVGNRRHTWTHQYSGRTIEQDLLGLHLYSGGPEALLPEWALAFYRQFRDEMLSEPTAGEPASPVGTGDDSEPAEAAPGGGPSVRGRAES